MVSVAETEVSLGILGVNAQALLIRFNGAIVVPKNRQIKTYFNFLLQLARLIMIVSD